MTTVRPIVAAAFVTLAGACTMTTPAPLGYSLVGGWAFKDRLAAATPIELSDCGTDFGIRYAVDGRFDGYEEAGRWSLVGDTLTETVEREPGEDGEMIAIAPRTHRGRLSWLSPRHANVDFDGEVSGMIRCPE